MVENFQNEEGRETPNFFPTLPEPVGRFTFDIFSPLEMIKMLIGPGLYRKICLCCWCTVFSIIFVFIGYFVFVNFIALRLAGVGRILTID
jgi:hypothetical protein